MKLKALTILTLALTCSIGSIKAQLPVSLNGPWFGSAGYDRGLHTGNNVAYGIIGFDFVSSTNTGLTGGVIAGVENLWHGSVSSEQSLSGGFQVSYTGKPLRAIGMKFGTNVTATVAAFNLLATPKDGTAPVGIITGTSLTLEVYNFNGYEVGIQGNYLSRTGQGRWNDTYIGGGANVSHDFSGNNVGNPPSAARTRDHVTTWLRTKLTGSSI